VCLKNSLRLLSGGLPTPPLFPFRGVWEHGDGRACLGERSRVIAHHGGRNRYTAGSILYRKDPVSRGEMGVCVDGVDGAGIRVARWGECVSGGLAILPSSLPASTPEKVPELFYSQPEAWGKVFGGRLWGGGVRGRDYASFPFLSLSLSLSFLPRGFSP
jgi:hypothetical protein